jgi:hypothetical protein
LARNYPQSEAVRLVVPAKDVIRYALGPVMDAAATGENSKQIFLVLGQHFALQGQVDLFATQIFISLRGDSGPQLGYRIDTLLDLLVRVPGVCGALARFEAKFMLPWSFSEVVAAEKYMPQLQHNMWVINARAAVLSIITGGGKWVEIAIPADALYRHLLLTAEKKFWRCVEDGEPPRLFGVEPPHPRIEAVRIVDMSASNAWAEFSGVFRRTREAYLEHENAKTELKALMPEDAKEAIGHGIRARRSKSGAVSFDVLSMEGSHAPLQ